MSEKKWTSEDMSAAVERALQTMEGVALELYRRGREPLLEELETVKRERDEARASAANQFRRGAEAMREACAVACRPILRSMVIRSELAKTLRALPIPEEP